jgi:hypothetical protein
MKHLEGRGISEDDHLQDRGHDQPEKRPPVAAQLEELLAQKVKDPLEHRR